MSDKDVKKIYIWAINLIKFLKHKFKWAELDFSKVATTT